MAIERHLNCDDLTNRTGNGSGRRHGADRRYCTWSRFKPCNVNRDRCCAVAITNAVPEARFAGPDGGSGNIDWTTRFAKAGKKSGLATMVTEHFYAGGKGKGVEAMFPADNPSASAAAGASNARLHNSLRARRPDLKALRIETTVALVIWSGFRCGAGPAQI